MLPKPQVLVELNAAPNIGDLVTIPAEELRHLNLVLRLEHGARFIVADINSNTAFAAEFDPESGTGKIIAPLPSGQHPRVNTLIVPLLKGDHNELIVEKVTEIGLQNIIIYAAERSVVKLDQDGANKKLLRWRSIAKAAAKQSKKFTVPNLLFASSLNGALKVATRSECQLVCSLEQTAQPLSAFTPPTGTVNLVIGPEGDLTGAELSTCLEYGYKQLSLGRSVLRAETAAIVACGSVSVTWGEVDN